jgi:hypothetical protein
MPGSGDVGRPGEDTGDARIAGQDHATAITG